MFAQSWIYTQYELKIVFWRCLQPLNLRPACITKLIQVGLLQRRRCLAQIQCAILAKLPIFNFSWVYLRICLFSLFFAMSQCWSTDIVSDVLDRYNRPTTNLFISASHWDCIIANAQKLPQSVFVILDNSQSLDFQELMKFLENHSSVFDNLIVLKWPISLNSLKKLYSCEHFDVLFFLNEESSADLIAESLGKAHLLVVSGHGAKEKYQLIESPSPFYLQLRSLIHNTVPSRKYRVEFSFQGKEFQKTFQESEAINSVKTEWVPGINLITYLMLNGIYPDRVRLAQGLPIEVNHSDWMPNNMLVQGSRIALIDYVNAHEAVV